MNYLLHIVIMVGIYAILSLSLNILVGQAGLLSLCHAAFYGIGAYTTTLVMVKAGFPFPIALASAVAAAALLSTIISVPTLRLKGDYFVLGSLAFQVIIYTVLHNWEGLTAGAFGISGIPRPSVFGMQLAELPSFGALVAVLAVTCALFAVLVALSPFGRVLRAIREDEIAAEAIGKNVTGFKVRAFAIAAGMAAVGGALFATYVSYIDPTSFALDEALFILACVVIGGAGTTRGPVLGAAILILLPEALRFLRVPDTLAPNLRQIMYGLLIVLFMRFRPQGIAGEYRFE